MRRTRVRATHLLSLGKSYPNHTLGMMRIIPLLCYTVADVGKTSQTQEYFRVMAKYQIRVQGWIGERWAGWFDGMTLTYEGTTDAPHLEDDSPITTLTGPVMDQAALRSLLSKIWDLNLTLISVTRVETSTEQRGKIK
jgi:hypothetical protein